MTEKRFTTDYNDFLKNDMTFIKNNNKRMTFQEVVDLLNELNDKSEFLEIENESLEDGATKYAELYHKSLKENEQLKKEAEEYNENAMSYQTLYEQQLEKFEKLLSECRHQQEQKMKFYNENKELKQTIQRLKQNITELLFVDIEEELLEENEQLKQQMQKINKLINSKIQSARELGSVRTVIALKNLQRELNGDV